uniref:Uncharacterized protein n=1 Tax=Romanomermis culicivorax TaxID=13658 RepID=A0A915KXA3_ROMCU
MIVPSMLVHWPAEVAIKSGGRHGACFGMIKNPSAMRNATTIVWFSVHDLYQKRQREGKENEDHHPVLAEEEPASRGG